MKTIIFCLLTMCFYMHATAQSSIAHFASSKKFIDFTESKKVEHRLDKIDNKAFNPPNALSIQTFYAKRSKKLIELTWQPPIDEGKSVFIVQKKTGSDWKTVAYVPCSSTSDGIAPSVYTFIDANPSKGLMQYKIHEVIDDENIRFSEIVSVEPEISHPFVAAYNSITGKIRLSFKTECIRDIKVLTDKGQLVKDVTGVFGKNVELTVLAAGTLNLLAREQETGAVTVEKIYIR